MKKHNRKHRTLPPLPPFHERHPFFVLFSLFFFMLLAGIWFRSYFFNSVLPGSEPYYHMKLSEIVLSQGFSGTETLLGFPRAFFLTPFHVFASNLVYFFGVFEVARFLPPILSFFCLLFLWLVLSKFRMSVRKRFFISLAFLLSPSFVSALFMYLPHSFSLFLFLFSLLSLQSRSSFWRFAGILSSLLFALQGLPEFLVLMLFLFFLVRMRNFLLVPSLLKPNVFYLAMLASSAAFLLRVHSFFQSISVSSFFSSLLLKDFSFQSLLTGLFTVFGSSDGLSLFAVVLSAWSFLLSWRRKRLFFPLYVLSVSLFVLSLYSGSAVLFLSLILSIGAGLVIDSLLSRRWSLELLRDFTAWLLVCGLLFSGAVQFSSVIHSRPSPEDVHALNALSELCSASGKVLSHPRNGFWIEAISGCTPFMDSNMLFTPDLSSRLSAMNAMFDTKDLNEARKLFRSFNIRYLFIDDFMKKGGVWSGREDGLLFLLRNNETFKRELKYPGIEIWSINLS